MALASIICFLKAAEHGLVGFLDAWRSREAIRNPFAKRMRGSHMSFSPDRSRIMDVVGLRVLWVSPVSGGKLERVYEFPEPDARIEYPVWSPDGKWVLFDRFRPQGGDIWARSGVE